MTALRMSPVHGRLEALGAQFSVRNGMAVAASLDDGDITRAARLGLADLSHLDKSGFKGALAPGWVQTRGFALPEPNRWTALEGGGMLARLAVSEFFIEDAAVGTIAARVRDELRRTVAGVYPVLRQDAGFALIGERVNDLLVETCNVNFRDPDLAGGELVMTTMVGVSVLVIRRDDGERPCYRLWCDPTMAPYLWDTLAEIARDLGGGPVGANALAASSQS